MNVAVQVNIDENKIDNFSDGAKTTLEKQIEKYTDDIIKEANLIEEAIREDGARLQAILFYKPLERIKIIIIEKLIHL